MHHQGPAFQSSHYGTVLGPMEQTMRPLPHSMDIGAGLTKDPCFRVWYLEGEPQIQKTLRRHRSFHTARMDDWAFFFRKTSRQQRVA